MKKALSVLLTLVMCLTLCACGKGGQYEDAVALMDAGDYEEAKSIFSGLDGYKDSVEKLWECEKIIALTNRYTDEDELITALVTYFEGSDEDIARLEANTSIHPFFQQKEDALNTYHKLMDAYSEKIDKNLGKFAEKYNLGSIPAEALITVARFISVEEYVSADSISMERLMDYLGYAYDVDSLSATENYDDVLIPMRDLFAAGLIPTDDFIVRIYQACNTTNWFWGIDAGYEPLGFKCRGCAPTIVGITRDIKGQFKDPSSVSVSNVSFAIVSGIENGIYTLPMEYRIIANIRATNSFGGYIEDTYLLSGNSNGRFEVEYKNPIISFNKIMYNGESYDLSFYASYGYDYN